jgi:uridine kinase
VAESALPLLALAGGAGSGKTTIARRLAAEIPRAALIHLDDCYHTDPDQAPTVHRYGTENGRIIDLSNPAAIDPARVRDALAQHRDAPLLIVEGVFALTLPYLRDSARWRVYIDAPADIQIARKTLRKINEGRDPAPVLRGYLDRGRQAHQIHIEPARHTADLVIDGTQPANLQIKHIKLLLDQPGKHQPASGALTRRHKSPRPPWP